MPRGPLRRWDTAREADRSQHSTLAPAHRLPPSQRQLCSRTQHSNLFHTGRLWASLSTTSGANSARSSFSAMIVAPATISYRSRSSVTKRGLSGLFSGCVLQNPPKVGWVLPLAYPRSWVVLVWRTGPSFRRYSGSRRFSKLAYCLIVYIKKWIKSPHS